ncbi:MAG: hypothetical protein NTW38_03245 [Candidatus Aminicenantes bacterium]|nr:hypothetical protein [Candidatus Aminicenantes bacterium]
MDDAKVWKGLERISAPADFEDRVFQELDRRHRTGPQLRKARLFKWALSGSAAALLAVFTVLNLFVFEKGARPALENSAGAVLDRDPIHVTESVDYGREVQAAASDPRTIYLLEQISDTSFSTIRY